MLEILKKYFETKREMRVSIQELLIRNLRLPLGVFVCVFVGSFYFFDVKHDAIASAMISVVSIIASFLIFSTTIVLTKKNEIKIRNIDVKYKDVLLSNILFSVFLSILSIGSILFYVFIANCKEVGGFRLFLSLLCSFNFGIICLIFNVLLGDLKFLVNIYKDQ